VAAAVDRLNLVLEEVGEAEVRAPSRLPGWSRGHVLTHLANFSEAMPRQVTEGLAGRQVDMYDGGPPARNAAIEQGAGRPAADLKDHVRRATAALLDAWNQVDERARTGIQRGTLLDTSGQVYEQARTGIQRGTLVDASGQVDAQGRADVQGGDVWRLPIRHRDSDLAASVYTGWREIEIHTIDLGLKPTSDDWSEEFCLHLLDFLRSRTPDNVHLVLRSPNHQWEAGTGETHILTGSLTDLAAWLAGREPQGLITGDQPDLKPWP